MCVYAVGFYDPGLERDRMHSVAVRVTRRGVRALHPSRFLLRSPAARREARLRAAMLSAGPSSSGPQARVIRLRPHKRGWEGLLAVSFPIEAEGERVERELGGVLRAGPKVRHRFDRRITLNRLTGGARRVTFTQPLMLSPGEHELSVVFSGDDNARVEQTRVFFEIPEVENRRLTVIGPILGRRARDSILIRGDPHDPNADGVGKPGSFEPLFGDRLDGPEDVLALTSVCVKGTKPERDPDARIERTLYSGSGDLLGEMPAADLSLERDGDVRCQNFVDVLPAASLGEGDYVFQVLLQGDGVEPQLRQTRLSVRPEEGGVSATETGSN